MTAHLESLRSLTTRQLVGLGAAALTVAAGATLGKKFLRQKRGGTAIMVKEYKLQLASLEVAQRAQSDTKPGTLPWLLLQMEIADTLRTLARITDWYSSRAFNRATGLDAGASDRFSREAVDAYLLVQGSVVQLLSEVDSVLAEQLAIVAKDLEAEMVNAGFTPTWHEALSAATGVAVPA